MQNLNISYKKSFLKYTKVRKKELLDNEIAALIDDLLRNLKFNQSNRGTFYLKLAILIAYQNQHLLFHNYCLMELVSKQLNRTEKAIRGSIDNSIYNMCKSTSVSSLNGFFYGVYDRKEIEYKIFYSFMCWLLK